MDEVDCFHPAHRLLRLGHILFERQRGAIEHHQVKTGLGGLASLLDRMSVVGIEVYGKVVLFPHAANQRSDLVDADEVALALGDTD